MQPNLFLLMDAKLHFLYQIQKDHFLNKFLYHSKTKIKGYFEFLNLMLFYILNGIHEHNQRMTSFIGSK